MPSHRHRLESIIRADPDLMRLFHAIRPLQLPQWRLVAGCIYQTVWNVLTSRPPRTGIKDYDLAYFDSFDLSWAAEDAVIRRVTAAAATTAPARVEPRNQARVHLWFEARFGSPYKPLHSTDEALGRYAAPVHAIGVRLEPDDTLNIAAPFGLDDLFALTIRPNPALANEADYTRKAARAKAIWPELTIISWPQQPPAPTPS